MGLQILIQTTAIHSLAGWSDSNNFNSVSDLLRIIPSIPYLFHIPWSQSGDVLCYSSLDSRDMWRITLECHSTSNLVLVM